MGCCGGRKSFTTEKRIGLQKNLFSHSPIYFNKGVYEEMRLITHNLIDSINKNFKLVAMDSPLDVGGNYRYRILAPSVATPGDRLLADIKFQKGVVDINGITESALLVILIDKLGGVSSPTAAQSTALTALKSALKELTSE